MSLPLDLYVMASLYFLAGINHFRSPRLYKKIIPPYFPNPKLLNIISGLAEISLAVLLCIPFYTKYAAWGIIALLIAVFPAHIYMFRNKKASLGLPKWILISRMALQFVLIYWSFHYTLLNM